LKIKDLPLKKGESFVHSRKVVCRSFRPFISVLPQKTETLFADNFTRRRREIAPRARKPPPPLSGEHEGDSSRSPRAELQKCRRDIFIARPSPLHNFEE
jgi:hypothetical protein